MSTHQMQDAPRPDSPAFCGGGAPSTLFAAPGPAATSPTSGTARAARTPPLFLAPPTRWTPRRVVGQDIGARVPSPAAFWAAKTRWKPRRRAPSSVRMFTARPVQKSTSELGYPENPETFVNLNAIELPQLQGQSRDGVERHRADTVTGRRRGRWRGASEI